MDNAKERTMAKYGETMKASLGLGRTPGTPAGMAAPTSGVGARMAGVASDREASIIEVGRIASDPEQPRRRFDEEEIDRLAESLKSRGQLQNLVVFWAEDVGNYVIVSGERRWRAARKAGLATLRCRVLPRRPDDRERLSLQLVENLARQDLRPTEQAAAFRALADLNGWSTRQVADELNIAQGTVVYALGLLDLPETLRDRVDRGELAPRTAYEIGRLDRPEDQIALAERVVAEKMTRDEVVAAVKAAKPVAKSGEAKGRGGIKGGKAKGKRAARITKKRVLKVAGGKVTLERAKGIEDDEYLRLAAEAILGLRQAPAGDQTVDEATTQDSDGATTKDSSPDDAEQGRGVVA